MTRCSSPSVPARIKSLTSWGGRGRRARSTVLKKCWKRRDHRSDRKEVVVIGGGNVSMDAVRTAKRLGAKKVSILYGRRRRNDMTALPGDRGRCRRRYRDRDLKGPGVPGCLARITRSHGIYATPQMISAIKDGRASVKPTGEPMSTSHATS